MATITKKIGSDGAPTRDYATATLHEAALGGAAGGAGNDAVGDCYDDSDFAEVVRYDDETPDAILIKAADGEEHDGTAGTGVTFTAGSNTAGVFEVSACAKPFEVRGIVIKPTAAGTLATRKGIHLARNGTDRVVRCIVDGVGLEGTGTGHIGICGYRDDAIILDCIVLNIPRASSHGVLLGGYAEDSYVLNTTVYNVAGEGISDEDETATTVRNNISVGNGTDFAGAPNVASNNLSTDLTAPGANSLTGKAVADQFVSTVGGSEDLHLKAGADAIGVGVDLGQVPADVEFDIDNYDRHTAAVVWDIGADQYVAVATGNRRRRFLVSCGA